MSQNIDYSKGIYDARQLGAGRMLILASSTCSPCSVPPCWSLCSPV